MPYSDVIHRITGTGGYFLENEVKTSIGTYNDI